IGENLLSVSDPISRPEERLIHAGALVRPPTLQRRSMSRLHPYVAVERSSPPVSPVPEPGHRSVGDIPLSPRLQTLLVQRLQAYLQCPHPYGAPSQQTATPILDTGDLSALSRLLVAADGPRDRGAYPDQLPLGLVAAECCPVL